MRQYQQVLANHFDPCSCPPPMPEDPTILRIPLRLAARRPAVSLARRCHPRGRRHCSDRESRENEFFYTAAYSPAVNGRSPATMTWMSWEPWLWLDTELERPPRTLRDSAVLRDELRSSLQAGCTFSGGRRATGKLRSPSIWQPLSMTRVSDPIIQPGDTLVLQYKATEELINFGLSIFFTYGIAEVLRGN